MAKEGHLIHSVVLIFLIVDPIGGGTRPAIARGLPRFHPCLGSVVRCYRDGTLLSKHRLATSGSLIPHSPFESASPIAHELLQISKSTDLVRRNCSGCGNILKMTEGRDRTGLALVDTKLIHRLDWPDFGPGHLPTSLSQGIESENILKLWDRLNDDNRTILEETLRKLPMSHFIWFEKLLDYLKYRFGEPWMTGDRYLFRCLVPSSSPALFKIYLRILTTPGREPGRLQHQNWYNPPISHNAWWHEWCDWRMSLNLDANANSHLADVDVNSDTEWLQLQKAVQELPIDINRMIRDSVHEIVFGPKDVVLPYVDPNDLRHFSALNSELYGKYHELYYSKNMWILADGPEEEIGLCFQSMSLRAPSQLLGMSLSDGRGGILTTVNGQS